MGVSTLDLVEPGRFLLVTSSAAWAGATLAVDLPITTVLVGREVLDPTGGWSAVSGIGEEGALLVRPDQHVAWRTTEAPADAAAELAEIVAILLGQVAP